MTYGYVCITHNIQKISSVKRSELTTIFSSRGREKFCTPSILSNKKKITTLFYSRRKKSLFVLEETAAALIRVFKDSSQTHKSKVHGTQFIKDYEFSSIPN